MRRKRFQYHIKYKAEMSYIPGKKLLVSLRYLSSSPFPSSFHSILSCIKRLRHHRQQTVVFSATMIGRKTKHDTTTCCAVCTCNFIYIRFPYIVFCRFSYIPVSLCALLIIAFKWKWHLRKIRIYSYSVLYSDTALFINRQCANYVWLLSLWVIIYLESWILPCVNSCRPWILTTDQSTDQ